MKYPEQISVAEFKSKLRPSTEKKRRNPPRYLESELQRNCVKEFKRQYHYLKTEYVNEKGELKQSYPLIKNCNEGDKSDAKRMIEYKEGLTPGVADMSLKIPSMKPTFIYYRLEIEFKRPGGKQRASQKAYQKMVEQQGYKYIIVDSFDQFLKEIREYL